MKRHLILRLLKLVSQYKKTFIGAVVLLVAASAIELSLPFLVGNTINNVLKENSASSWNYSIVIIFLLLVFRALLLMGENYLIPWIGERIVIDLRTHMFNHLLRMPISFHIETSPGVL